VRGWAGFSVFRSEKGGRKGAFFVDERGGEFPLSLFWDLYLSSFDMKMNSNLFKNTLNSTLFFLSSLSMILLSGFLYTREEGERNTPPLAHTHTGTQKFVVVLFFRASRLLMLGKSTAAAVSADFLTCSNLILSILLLLLLLLLLRRGCFDESAGNLLIHIRILSYTQTDT